MKFGKIQKFKKIKPKIDSFDHSGHAKVEIWQNQEIFSCIENLAQKWDFWPLQTCEGWNLAKSRYFQSRCKFNLKSRVWPPLTCQWWNFDSCQKFSSKLTFLTIQDMRKMKVGKIQKFSIAIKIKPKIESFDHSGHTNDEIWQNPEILSRALWLEIWLKKEIFDKAWQNPDILSCIENLAQNWHFWLIKDLQRTKFCKIKKFWVVLKIWLKTNIFDHSGHAKDEMW